MASTTDFTTEISVPHFKYVYWYKNPENNEEVVFHHCIGDPARISLNIKVEPEYTTDDDFAKNQCLMNNKPKNNGRQNLLQQEVTTYGDFSSNKLKTDEINNKANPGNFNFIQHSPSQPWSFNELETSDTEKKVCEEDEEQHCYRKFLDVREEPPTEIEIDEIEKLNKIIDREINKTSHSEMLDPHNDRNCQRLNGELDIIQQAILSSNIFEDFECGGVCFDLSLPDPSMSSSVFQEATQEDTQETTQYLN